MSAENCLTVFAGKICDLDVGQFFIPKHITERRRRK
jgi:hypothetical protein